LNPGQVRVNAAAGHWVPTANELQELQELQRPGTIEA
jgi:hypothetical protein